jgi:hypothetical protein
MLKPNTIGLFAIMGTGSILTSLLHEDDAFLLCQPDHIIARKH